MLSQRIENAEYLDYEIRRAFAKAPEPYSPEQNLFREVIARAMFDALGYTIQSRSANHHRAAVEEAYKFFHRSAYYYELCDWAEIEPGRLREAVLRTKPLTHAASRGIRDEIAGKPAKRGRKWHSQKLRSKSRRPLNSKKSGRTTKRSKTSRPA